MGAGDKGMAHQGILTAHRLGKYRVQGIPASVVVAIAGGAVEMIFRHIVFNKGRKDLQLIVFTDFLNPPEGFPAHFLRLFCLFL